MIKIFNSNSLEKLSDIFGSTVQTDPLESPLDEETVLVQSIGMGRWLSISMAEKKGVWANFKYQYPNSFFNELSGKTVLKNNDFEVADKKTVCWKIFSLLSKNPQKYSKDISNYCSGSSLKTWQLAEKISDIFDQYSIYRPEMISKWNEGHQEINIAGKWVPIDPDDQWQTELWSDAVKNFYLDRSQLKYQIIKILNSQDAKKLLPQRISVFGVSTIPLYYLEILSAVSMHIPVFFYLLNPCSDFWFYDKSVKEVLKIRQNAESAVEFESMHLETGNTLLSSFGRLGLEFHSMMIETFSDNNPDLIDHDDNLFLNNQKKSLLNEIKNDILYRKNRDPHEEAARVEISAHDSSISVHSCYNIQREVEILHDHILDIINSDKKIFPRDILVMTPEIETYAPYIESVFSGTEENQRIPYSIADLNLKKSFEITETLLDILNIRQERFSSAKIFDILQKESVKKKFSLTDDHIEKLKMKTASGRICWGTDEKFRLETAGIEFEENSWNTGIERFLAGLTVLSEGNRLVFDTLPFEEIENIDFEALGNFIDFIRTIEYVSNEITKAKTVQEWNNFLNDILDSVFYEYSENSSQFNEIRSQLNQLSLSHSKSGHTEKISPEIMIYLLDNIFTGERVSFGFLDGRVTFCAVLPMRSIPFKMIAMLGLNDGVFPGTDKPLSFDLIAKYRKYGDRSRKNDDRYLFLENLVSAGEFFYLSYIGRSITDDSAYPPSVAVSELLNYIEGNFFIAGRKIRENIIRNHSLHSFSRKYFTSEDARFFSYSEDNLRLLNDITAAPEEKTCLKAETHIPEELLDISLADFVSFFINPSRYFLQRKLGIFFSEDSVSLDSDEPFELDYSDDAGLITDLVYRIHNNEEISGLYLLKSGLFPPKNLGKLQLDRYIADAENLHASVKNHLDEYREQTGCDTVVINVRNGEKTMELKIHADNGSIGKKGILIFRKKKWDRDYAEIFIRHAFNCLFVPESESRIIDLSEHVLFRNIDQNAAKKYIHDLAEIYIRGLKSPVPFFLKAGLEFSDGMNRKDADTDKNFSRASLKYNSDYMDFGTDYSCRYTSYLFSPDLGEYRNEFIELADIITKPVIENIRTS